MDVEWQIHLQGSLEDQLPSRMNFLGRRFSSHTCRLVEQTIAAEVSFLASGFSQLPTVSKGMNIEIRPSSMNSFFYLNFSANSVYLILGAHNTSDLSPYAEPNRVAYLNVQYFLHPLWNPNTLMSDLALVKLPENVAFNCTCVYHISKQFLYSDNCYQLFITTCIDYIRPICLPDSTDPDHVGDSVTLTGWGWYDCKW